MNIIIGKSNKQYDNNYIAKTTNNFFLIPFITIYTYFIVSKENLYFLALGLIQLSTAEKFALLPSHWSPTGPYNTIVPLFLCFLIDLIINYINWLTQKRNEISENYRKIIMLNCKKKYSKNIYPGDIIIIPPKSIIPVDCIAIDCKDNKNPNISLSTLNGETDLVPVKTLISENYSLDYLFNKNLVIKNYYFNDLSSLKCKLENKNINEKYFLPGGAVNMENTFTALVVACGKNKKCHNQIETSKFIKQNELDKYNGEYMMSVNVKFLLGIIFFITIMSYFFDQNSSILNPIYFIQKLIQTWILFNGIVPFSMKILTLVSKSAQSILHSFNFKIINFNITDQAFYVDKIISDKTGTLTENVLDFSKLILPNNTIINVLDNNLDYRLVHNNIELINCLGLCIHLNNGRYSTAEDKIIRKRYYCLGCKIYQENDMVTIEMSNGLKQKYQIIHYKELEFSSARKRSSMIVKNITNDQYFIYTKGSIGKMRELVKNSEILDENDQIIIDNYPSLRVLACGYKQLTNDFLYETMDSVSLNNLENNLQYLGIIGLKDNIQIGVKETVEFLKKQKKYVSICTGDRKETALAIANDCGILEQQIIDLEDKNKESSILKNDLYNSTLVFSGQFLSNNAINSLDNLEVFNELILRCPNFIAYSLLPKHKKALVDLIESIENKVLAIGDGTNDIPMIKASALGVAIKTENNANVVENADVVMHKFNELKNFIAYSYSSYYKNVLCSNYTIFKTKLLFISLFIYIISMYFSLEETLIQGFEIQGFHILWGTAPIIFITSLSNNDIITSNTNFTYEISIIFGVLAAIFISTMKFFLQMTRLQILFSLVLALNLWTLSYLKLIKNKLLFILTHVISVGLFVIYWVIFIN